MAAKTGKKARSSFRINPDVDAGTHKHSTSGTQENKFGIPLNFARDYYRQAAGLSNVAITGVDLHLGSSIFSIEPYIQALDKIKILVRDLQADGIRLPVLDMGGGFGIVYKDESPFNIMELAGKIIPHLADMGVQTLVLEPGRYIVGMGGVLVVRASYVKETGHKVFIITDGGMNDLIRPALYDAYHEIFPVKKNQGSCQVVDVVGPICESSDYFAQSRLIQPMGVNDGLVIMNAGAYGFSMSSQYNSRPRSAEILVDGSHWRLIRKRERYENLIWGEDCDW